MKSFQSFDPKFLEEKTVRLTPSELNKDNTKTGESRADILIRLIKNGDPIELFTGKKIKIPSTPELISEIERWRDSDTDRKAAIGFLDDTGFARSTSDIGKTAVFGGGGGAGGGTQNTKETESHQCAMLQAMLDHGIHDMEYYTDEVITGAFKRIFVDATIDEVLKANESEKWKTSSYYTAIYLITNKIVNKSMTFHRGDKEMNYIYQAKKEAFKNNGFPVLKDDKWNPGDIWAKKKDLNLNKALPVDAVASLNLAILELYTSRELVGISLKLVKKESPAVSEHNVETPPDTDDHKVMDLQVKSGRGSFFSNKGGSVVFDEGSLELRDGSAYGAVKAELKGKNARGGGAGWSVMIDAANQVFRTRLNSKFKATIVKPAKAIAKGDKTEIKKMFAMFQEFDNNTSENEFKKQLAKKDGPWISAKLGVLTILHTVNKQSMVKQNRWVTKVVNYAGSKSEDSSAYIKIGK